MIEGQMQNEEEVKGFLKGQRPGQTTVSAPEVKKGTDGSVMPESDNYIQSEIDRISPRGTKPTPTRVPDKEGRTSEIDAFFNNTSMATQEVLTNAKNINTPKIDYTDAENKVSQLPYPWNTLKPEALSIINNSLATKTGGSFGANDVVNSLFEISENDEPIAEHSFGDALAVFDDILTTQIRDMINVSDMVKVKAAREYVEPVKELFKKFAQGMGNAVGLPIQGSQDTLTGENIPVDLNFDTNFLNEYGFDTNDENEEPVK